MLQESRSLKQKLRNGLIWDQSTLFPSILAKLKMKFYLKDIPQPILSIHSGLVQILKVLKILKVVITRREY